MQLAGWVRRGELDLCPAHADAPPPYDEELQ